MMSAKHETRGGAEYTAKNALSRVGNADIERTMQLISSSQHCTVQYISRVIWEGS